MHGCTLNLISINVIISALLSTKYSLVYIELTVLRFVKSLEELRCFATWHAQKDGNNTIIIRKYWCQQHFCHFLRGKMLVLFESWNIIVSTAPTLFHWTLTITEMKYEYYYRNIRSQIWIWNEIYIIIIIQNDSKYYLIWNWIWLY